MKKTLAFVILFWASFSVKAQVINPKSLIGKTYIVDSIPKFFRKYGYKNFIKDINKSKYSTYNEVYTGNGVYETPHDSLVNQKFLCIDAGQVPDNPADYYMKLKNDKAGVIYFIYSMSDTKFEYLYSPEDREKEQLALDKANEEFEAKRKQAEVLFKNPCLTIEREYDEFHNTTTFSTPGLSQHLSQSSVPGFEDSEFYNVLFFKNIKKGIVTYQCHLNTTALTAVGYVKGVILLLQNGRKINKPGVVVKTSVDNKARFVRSATFFLDATDRALLKSSPIKGFELYDVQSDVVRPDDMYKMFICLLDKK